MRSRYQIGTFLHFEAVVEDVEQGTRSTAAMAENIYSKGTQVWFPDKELSWISGEVTTVTKNADDTVKLVFVDERGKVGSPVHIIRD